MQREMVLSIAGRIENELHALALDNHSDAFAKWLLEEYLPSLHRLGLLPDCEHVADKAIRAWAPHGPEDDAPKRVLSLLRELDRALYFAFELKRCGFFAAEHRDRSPEFKTQWGRAFAEKFERRATRYVAFQLDLNHPYTRSRSTPVEFHWSLWKDGICVYEELEVIEIGAQWMTSWVATTWGAQEPGSLARGSYRGTARLLREVVATATFEVT